MLAGAPPTQPGADVLDIEDTYLDGTRLRLRVVHRAGGTPTRKLGQKVRSDPAHPSTVAHTTMYLSAAEHEALRALPGASLHKTRTLLPWGSLTIALDVFAGALQGLVLAEVDLGEDGRLPGPLPLPVLAEVTDDERWTGGALARTTAAQLQDGLAGLGTAPA